MGAENDPAAERHLVELVDENDPFFMEFVDNEFIVNNLLPHVNRLSVHFQCEVDNIDGANDPGTESPGGSQNHFFVVVQMSTMKKIKN